MKIIREVYGWYKNVDAWIWPTVLFLGTIISGYSIELILRHFIYRGVGVFGSILGFFGILAGLLFQLLLLSFALAKITESALAKRNFESKKVGRQSVFEYTLLILLVALIQVAALAGGMIILSLFSYAGKMVFSFLFYLDNGGMGSFSEKNVIPVLLWLVVQLLIFIVVVLLEFYIVCRLAFASIIFWVEKGCGVIDAVKLSIKRTEKNTIQIALGIVTISGSTILGALILIGLGIVAAFFVPYIGAILTNILLLLGVILAQSGSIFGSVELYDQTVGIKHVETSYREKQKKRKHQ
ncbi:MAG: hypothetical protein QXW70_01805 [Candidatus Anstonellales archaeon]